LNISSLNLDIAVQFYLKKTQIADNLDIKSELKWAT
jgi:hypothetical protein